MRQRQEIDLDSMRRPSLTVTGRENQCISAAMDLAERQIHDGTASSQVITHFLRLGSSMAELEREKLERENQLLAARTENLQSSKRIEEMMVQALSAMRSYGGSDDD